MTDETSPPTTLEEQDTERVAELSQLDISDLKELAIFLKERLSSDLRIKGSSLKIERSEGNSAQSSI